MPTARSRSPQTSDHCIFYGCGVTKEDSTNKGWKNALLTERRDAVKISIFSLSQSFLSSGSLLIANTRPWAWQVPLSCCRLTPLYFVVGVGEIHGEGWSGIT